TKRAQSAALNERVWAIGLTSLRNGRFRRDPAGLECDQQGPLRGRERPSSVRTETGAGSARTEEPRRGPPRSYYYSSGSGSCSISGGLASASLRAFPPVEWWDKK